VPHRAGSCAVRAVLTCRPSPKISNMIEEEKYLNSCRMIELGLLSSTEREAVARYWILRHSDQMDPPANLLGVVTEKESAASPLYIAALCHATAHLFKPTSFSDRFQRNNADSDPAHDYESRLNEKPEGLVQLFEAGLLKKLEALHGRALVSEVSLNGICR
jgi:hypothetical protein